MQLKPSAEPSTHHLLARVVHRTEQRQEMIGLASIHPGVASHCCPVSVTTTARITPQGGIEALASIVPALDPKVPTVKDVTRDISSLSLDAQSNIDDYEAPPSIFCPRPILTNIGDHRSTSSPPIPFPKPQINIDDYEAVSPTPRLQPNRMPLPRVPVTSDYKAPQDRLRYAYSDHFYKRDKSSVRSKQGASPQPGLA
ncbi:hypothetical protein M378DRAFT_19132 [Amanita muscaria Koide BX008]|uniref:Uncharacterized protein n=1 Tax=Amanita muscaria (strain Koide BX008) TaxID=946122 RepID=A0A0C2WC95_AMAMK|nr:hypothetical protein M378DRAFT_19132 [Amanita muscaria Koide BX008]